ncbi:MAG: EAL domain-containing protein [Rhodanobacteraceae bacterium]|nr:EAL domain-containing protein [Rhodanobacteraceae bacterium]MBL0041313.1 EAL domain-containing protein [Xanthomonadales bacterium]MBP6077475.1 EAL domain-containing protein [Xanthomonadales bacterium]
MSLRQRWWLLGSLVAMCVVVLAAVALQQHRVQAHRVANAAAQREFALAEEALAERGRVAADLLAESLVNPTYFFDLQRIGEVLGGALNRGDIGYVLLLDRDGRILHDGSDNIARFGQQPDDPLAAEAAATTRPEVFVAERFIEVAHPITLGDQRLATLRLALKRGDTRVAPLPVKALPAWLDPLLLAGLATSFVGLLAFGDRRFVVPRLRTDARLQQLARVHAGAANDVDPRAALDHVEQRLAGFEGELQQLGRIDALTGLPNRIALRLRIGDAIQHAQRSGDGELALLFIDLDDFKRINDTLGHDVGDEILAAVARRFSDILHSEHPQEQGFIARFGGDEFVMLLSGRDARRRAGEIAELLLSSLRIPLNVADQLLHVSASIGITSFPDDAADASRLIKNGDIAMYLAKVQGRNCARYFTNYLTRLAEDRLAIEQDLRAALDRDELKLHYQPIIDFDSGHIHGAEALLRWHHPSRGLVSTALFVGIAEDVGLIDALGDFALRTACDTAVRWPRSAGRAPFVAVNVSVKQLRDHRFPARVAQVLADTGLAAELLHLELTESSLLDGESAAIAALESLHEIGVKLWLDDFGTGFSGLNHLRRVPVSGVKIDRSFVADLLTDRHDVALTSAIIAMARSLDITVVAEGVESAALAEVLGQLDCPYGQGYWFGEPAHSEKLVEHIIAQRYGDRSQANVVPIS